MDKLLKLSLRTKIVLICLSVSFLVLLFSSTVYVYFTVLSQTKLKEEHFLTLTKATVVSVSPALLFEDINVAEESLAPLKTIPDIINVFVFRSDSSLFISMAAGSSKHPLDATSVKRQAVVYTDGELYIYSPIMLDGEYAGYVLLIASRESIQQAVRLALKTAVFVFISAIVFALVLSAYFQQWISAPILNLTNVMRLVSKEKNYEVRVDPVGQDEVSELIHGFNEMLSQIYTSNIKLESNRQYLEEQVEKRTKELSIAIEDMRKAKELAEEASSAKSAFLATMSHEIRTPLNGVLGVADLIDDGSLTAQQQRYLAVAKNSGELLIGIINDILDLSKIEAGKMLLESHPFDLADVIENVLLLFARQAHEKRLNVSYNMPWPHSHYVVGDSARLRQILANLISNAIKFTKEGEISVTLYFEQNEYVLVIADTGIGIAKENQQSIFQAFTQADTSMTRRFGGTGLGLAICQNLITQMGGTITCQTKLGKGTKFTARLPLKYKIKEFCPLTFSNSFSAKRWFMVSQDKGFLAMASKIIGKNAELLLLDRVKTLSKHDMAHAILLLDMRLFGQWKVNLEGVNLLKDVGELGCRTLAFLPTTLLNNESLPTQYPSLSILSLPILPEQIFSALINKRLCNAFENQSKRMKLQGHLLLVDDTMLNQELAGEMLTRLGLTYDLSTDGAAALEKMKSRQYDAVLMDCQMPIMDGYEATRAWRIFEKEQGNKKLPVIAMTAHATAEDRSKCLATGMDEHLTKPLSQRRMYDVLKLFLPERVVSKGGKEIRNNTSIKSLESFEVPISTGVIKRETLKMLYDMTTTDNNLLTKMINMYRNEAPKFISIIVDGEQDTAILSHAAHELKSYSYNLGVTKVAEQAAIFEAIFNQGNYLHQDQKRQLLDQYAEAEKYLHNYVEEYEHANTS